jgi:hypothetical protein
MFDKCKNSKKKGDIGVGEAISFFIRKGQTVLFPLSDSEPYDLAYDDGDKLNKVQIRTTAAKSPHGIYIVNLRVMGGNQSFHTEKKFDRTKVDYLFVLTENGKKYLIPSVEITSYNSINLGKQMEKYKL